ncbi:flagellar brake protein [Thermodesulfobacteriota bacterium B35]
MSSLDSVFAKIEDGKAVRVALPIKDEVEKRRISCVYRAEEPPRFSLLFTPGSLPAERIDRHRKCMVLIDIAGQSVSLAADIESIPDKETLTLVARDVISHQQMREYFRVDVSTPIVAAPLLPLGSGDEEEAWRLTGETIDVSGSGLLAVFPEPLEKDRQVRVDLVLPSGDGEVVQMVGHVVRTRKIRSDRYHVGLHFDLIDSDTRDKIMACCFDIQRRHLRLKVQVKDRL